MKKEEESVFYLRALTPGFKRANTQIREYYVDS